MLWRLTCERIAAPTTKADAAGRFVLHQHRDEQGPHLDLRLEHEGYLLGWRIEGVSFEGRTWALTKSPHSARWLDHDADAQRLDDGAYSWELRTDRERVLLLHGAHGTYRIRGEAQQHLDTRTLCAISEALRTYEIDGDDLAQLIDDGVQARKRAIARLCGLGKELDEDAFDEHAWRALLQGVSLSEIQSHLRAFETRFDRKYPPQPISQPEPIPEEQSAPRNTLALTIARE